MAAPIKTVVFDFGLLSSKFQHNRLLDIRNTLIFSCSKCNSKYSIGSKYLKSIGRRYIDKNTLLLQWAQTTNFKGDNSRVTSFSDFKNILINGSDRKCWSSRSSKLFNKSVNFASQIRSVSTCSRLLNVDQGNVKVADGKLEKIHDPKENIKTIPNILTLGRILSTPVIGYLVVEQSFPWALGLFVCAGITDMLDGVIARNMKNQTSALGTALDPLADKILITVLTVTLATANLLPVPLAVLIIGRDILLIAAAFYIRFISLPPPRTLSRYFDVTNPTAKLMPSTLSKINTILQLVLVSCTLAAPVFNFVDHPALQALWYITGATTFCSGVGYVWSRNNYVKFLRKGMERKF